MCTAMISGGRGADRQAWQGGLRSLTNRNRSSAGRGRSGQQNTQSRLRPTTQQSFFTNFRY